MVPSFPSSQKLASRAPRGSLRKEDRQVRHLGFQTFSAPEADGLPEEVGVRLGHRDHVLLTSRQRRHRRRRLVHERQSRGQQQQRQLHHLLQADGTCRFCTTRSWIDHCSTKKDRDLGDRKETERDVETFLPRAGFCRFCVVPPSSSGNCLSSWHFSPSWVSQTHPVHLSTIPLS